MNNLKQFISDEEAFPNPIYYRPGTLDLHLIQKILVAREEYKFPQYDAKIIYDIGANIGIATLLINSIYPDAVIHCFEPEPENFEILRKNVEHLGDRVVLNKVALGNTNGTAMLYGPELNGNHGGFSQYLKPEKEFTPGCQVPVARVSQYMAKVGTPEIIKIDCEGAEYDILTDIADISKVAWIAGELHSVKDYELMSYLSSKGFSIESARHFGEKNWPFHAANTEKFSTKDASQQRPGLAADM